MRAFLRSCRALAAMMPFCAWLAPKVIVHPGKSLVLTTGRWGDIVGLGGTAFVRGRVSCGSILTGGGSGHVVRMEGPWRLTVYGGIINDACVALGIE